MSHTIIIGGGIAGLTAAYYLQKAGKSYQVLEASARIGGRIKTDVIDGFRLDRGFQVFLTAYPEAKKILNYNALDLKAFDAGAVLLRKEGKTGYIGDPLRQLSSLIPTLTTSAASLSDKFKILSTKSRLTSESINEIFGKKEISTLSALEQDYGFSDTIITEFLKPFYAGIFLESDLSTSRRMFDFVFKMFSEGEAAIPALGMEEIPKQIAGHLDLTKIICNTKVIDIQGGVIHADQGQKFNADQVIIAIEATGLCKKYAETNQKQRSTTNLYFSSEKTPYTQNAIALNGASDGIVNNMVCLTKASKQYSNNGHLISVSLKDGVDHNQSDLIKKVKNELSRWINSATNWDHIKTYKINYALPDQTHINNRNLFEVSEKMTIIGDHTMNGSINAAMKSGRLGAERVIAMV